MKFQTILKGALPVIVGLVAYDMFVKGLIAQYVR